MATRLFCHDDEHVDDVWSSSGHETKRRKKPVIDDVTHFPLHNDDVIPIVFLSAVDTIYLHVQSQTFFVHPSPCNRPKLRWYPSAGSYGDIIRRYTMLYDMIAYYYRAHGLFLSLTGSMTVLRFWAARFYTYYDIDIRYILNARPRSVINYTWLVILSQFSYF